MSETKKPCGHEGLVFGCDKCITFNRDTWEQARYAEWAKEYPKHPKICSKHKKPLVPFTRSTIDGKLVGIAGCQVLANGEFECEDEDDVVVLE